MNYRTQPHAAEETAFPPQDLQALFMDHYASIWRLLRRLGLRESDLDDATQEVFWVAARRIADIRPGCAHTFLYGVALRVASSARRQSRNQDGPLAALDLVATTACDQPNPEQRLQDRQARELLDRVLDQMTPSLRATFVLYELESVAIKDIAEIEDIPVGTVNSRLRRAREEFSIICARVQATAKRTGA